MRDVAASKELAAKDDNEPAPTKSAAPKRVEFRTISRAEDPVSSRLGFTCGSVEQRQIVVRPNLWHLLALNLSSPMIVGHVSASLDLSEFCARNLELAIFTATGEQLFRIEMREPNVRFDDLKLPSGDLLLAYRAPRGAEGHGSYDLPFSRILAGELPAAPQLDELILGPGSDDGDPAKCGVPRFTFSSR